MKKRTGNPERNTMINFQEVWKELTFDYNSLHQTQHFHLFITFQTHRCGLWASFWVIICCSKTIYVDIEGHLPTKRKQNWLVLVIDFGSDYVIV